MIITRALLAQIIREAKRVSGVGRRGDIEVGYRWNDATVSAEANALCWPENNDLYDTCKIRTGETLEVGDFAPLPNCATLDLYCYSTGDNGQLECNVYVTIKDGQLADVHQDDLQSDARCRAILGVDFSKD
jgi:hypothetical protein